MENFTLTSAFEWATFGVRVNAIAPGWIASSGMDTYDGPIKSLIPKLKDAVPLKRMGTESEVSGAILLSFIGGRFIYHRSDHSNRWSSASGQQRALWPLQAEAQNVTTFNGFHRAVTPEILKQETPKD